MPRRNHEKPDPNNKNTIRCALCGREVPPDRTNVHHMTPRSHGGTAEDEVLMCRMCHRFLHATFTNRTLAESFDSIEALRQDPEVWRFVRWARKQKPHRNIDVDPRKEKR